MVTQRLYAAVLAVAPIDGISIGRVADKSSWRIDFASTATAEQRAAAAAVAAGFDLAAPEPHQVSKVTVIRRLQAAGKFEAALAALKAGPLLYELWSAVPELASDDTNARALFAAVGADADAILAPEAP